MVDLKYLLQYQRMLNSFENDNAYIGTKWFLCLITTRGLEVHHLLRIVHSSTGATHHLAILRDGRYICDCCMGLNLGLPCRHFFQAWTKIQGLRFHISFIRSRYRFDWSPHMTSSDFTRWYQDPLLNVNTIHAVTMNRTVPSGPKIFPWAPKSSHYLSLLIHLITRQNTEEKSLPLLRLKQLDAVRYTVKLKLLFDRI